MKKSQSREPCHFALCQSGMENSKLGGEGGWGGKGRLNFNLFQLNFNLFCGSLFPPLASFQFNPNTKTEIPGVEKATLSIKVTYYLIFLSFVSLSNIVLWLCILTRWLHKEITSHYFIVLKGNLWSATSKACRIQRRGENERRGT